MNISFLTEKLPYSQICGTKVSSSYKKTASISGSITRNCVRKKFINCFSLRQHSKFWFVFIFFASQSYGSVMPAGFEIAWIFRLKPIAFFVDVILNVSFISIEMATSSLLDLRGIDWSDNETVGGFWICNLKKWLQKYRKIGDIFYIEWNFAFLTPEIFHFLHQKLCTF